MSVALSINYFFFFMKDYLTNYVMLLCYRLKAGRVASLDTLAADFFTFPEERQRILGEAEKAAKTAGAHAKYYTRVMGKFLSDSEEWVKKETTRLVIFPFRITIFPFTYSHRGVLFRLESILKKKSLAPSKLDEIKIKANILAAFVEKKIEEAVEDAEEAAEDVVDKVKEEIRKVKEEL